MNKLLLTSFFFLTTVLLLAQPTINQSSYDLQFAEEIVDCNETTPTICVSVQIKSATVGESFRIGSHTVFFNYNNLSIESPTYTSSHFNASNLCISNQFAAYGTPSFSFDANTSEANFTTIAAQGLTDQLCPLVTDEWQTMGVLCFEIQDLSQSTGLQFDSDFTSFNYIDPTASNNIGDPQDKAEHNQGDLLIFDIFPTCPCSQSIEILAEATQEFCESGVLDLEVAANQIEYSGDGTVFEVEWFIDVDYNTPYTSSMLSHSGINLCEQETFLLYAKATCTIDDTEYDGGTLEVKIYPTPQAPTIVRSDDECAYVVMPACTNDVLSETAFNLMPSEAEADRNITVTSPFNENCIATFEVPYEKCPDPVCDQTITQTTANLQSFCEGGTPDLSIAEMGITYSGDGSIFSVEWFENNNFTTSYTPKDFNHSQVDLCAIEKDTLFARAICSIDNTIIEAGILVIELYPPLQSPTIIRQNDECNYIIQPFCEDDILSETAFDLQPDTEASNRTISLVSPFDENCTADFEVTYEACPALVCEQTITQTIASNQSFCENGTPSLIVAEAELTYSGDGTVFSIEWFEDQELEVPYLEHSFTHSNADLCESELDTLFAKATCSVDNSVLNAGFIAIVLYPPVQAPEIVRNDDACSYLVQPFCENDVLSETAFTLSPATEDGNRNIEVTSNFSEDCNNSFEVTYEACPEPMCDDSIIGLADAEQFFCEEGMPDLSLAEMEIAYSGDGNTFLIEWFENESFAAAYESELVERDFDNDCGITEVILYARATCSVDNSVYNAGVLRLFLYPEPQMPSIVRENDFCDYKIVPFCAADLLSEEGFDFPPDSEGGFKTIEVSSDLLDSPCEAVSFEVAFEGCPALVCSQNIEVLIDAEEAFCESGTPDLEVAEMELVYSGDGSVFVIDWFEDEGFEVVYDGGILAHSMDNVCESETKVLYARATCNEDDSVIEAGTLSLQFYPALQVPSIERFDNECNYIVVPVCEDDVLSETTFEVEPDSPAANRTIAVTSGMEGNICETGSFEVTYEACPPPFCDLEVISAIPSLCDPTNNVYNLEVTITYGTIPNAPVSIVAGGVEGGGMLDGSGEQIFVLEDLPANGEIGVDVMADLVINNICVDTLFNAYDAPESCAVDLCDMLEIGTLPSDNQFICFGDVLQVNHSGAMLPEETVLVYVLHSTPNNALTNPLYINQDGVFDLAEMLDISVNIPYYISVIGGFDTDGNGIPEFENNDCLKESNPMPVVFLTEIGIDFEIILDEENQTFDIRITASGGQPAFNTSFYQVELSNGIQATIELPSGMVVLENLPLMDEPLSISVTDFAACTAMVENIAVGVEELLFLEDFKIAYISDQTLQLQFWSLERQDVEILLYDLNGRVLIQKSTTLTKGFNGVDWSLGNLPVGVYLLQVNDGQESFVKKVVRF